MAKLKGSNPYCIGNLIEDMNDGNTLNVSTKF